MACSSAVVSLCGYNSGNKMVVNVHDFLVSSFDEISVLNGSSEYNVLDIRDRL